MPFKKGKSGNPSGKPKGLKSQKTVLWEKLGEWVVNEGAERYMEIIQDQNDEEFKKDFLAIIEYFKPKQVRQDTNIAFNGELPSVIIKSK